jgi:hypothetical protein
MTEPDIRPEFACPGTNGTSQHFAGYPWAATQHEAMIASHCAFCQQQIYMPSKVGIAMGSLTAAPFSLRLIIHEDPV